MRAGSRWVVLGRVVLFFAVCALLLMIAEPICAKIPGQWSQVALGLVTSVGSYGVTRMFLRWDRLRPEDVGVAPARQSWSRMLAGFGVGLLLVFVQTLLVRIAGHVTWVRGPGVSFMPGVVALMAYVLLAAREELAFRGYPLRRLDSVFGVWKAQFMVAAVFALEHLGGGYSWKIALLGAFVGSLLFGMAAIATRGLAVPIGIHAAWNFGQWVLGEKESAGLWTPVIAPGYKGYVNNAGMIGYLIMFGVAIWIFWMVGRRRAKRESPIRSSVPQGRQL